MVKDTRAPQVLISIYNFPLHTILFSAYPILYVYSRNLMNIPFRDTIRFLLIFPGFFLFLLISFRIILKDWSKSGMLCSVIAILFYAFGHVANAFESFLLATGRNFSRSGLAWTWLTLFLITSYFIVSKPTTQATTRFFNLISILLFSFTATTILKVGEVNTELTQEEIETLAQLRGQSDAESSLQPVQESRLPDIYYIILDGYLRADYLDEYFNYDNSPFLAELKERGFYVLSESRSNYLNTNYSLNSSLNLVYFHEYPIGIFNKSKYDLYNNYLHDFLKNYDYLTVVFDSGTGDTNEQDTDIFITPDKNNAGETQILNRFEQFFLKTTLVNLLFSDQSRADASNQSTDLIKETVNKELTVRRERIKHALEHLPDYAADPGHFYLFSHIYLPHIPFLYGPNGEELKYHGDQNLYWYEVPKSNYPEYYAYQLNYLNDALLKTIDNILLNSRKPVVIIIQADHGDEFYLDRDAPTKIGLEVRSAILNAIYFSDREYDSLYPSITPVNTFRVVLNHWFGTQYPLLPDQVYFHEDPLDTRINEKPMFIECCIEFNICLSSPPD